MSSSRKKVSIGAVHPLTGSTPDGLRRETPFPPSTIEMVDEAMFRFVKDANLHTRTVTGNRKIPVLWASSERAFQVKNEDHARDVSGSLVLPVITVERTSIDKSPTKKGAVVGAIPEALTEKGGVILTARRIKKNKSPNFVNAQARRRKGTYNFAYKSMQPKDEKVIYESVFMPLPVYFTAMYSINVKTEHEQQMNDVIQFFIAKPGGVNYLVLPTKHGHRYEAFVQNSYPRAGTANDPDSNERVFETSIEVEVLGYVMGEGPNRDKPFESTYENRPEIRTPRSNAIYGGNTVEQVYQKDDFGERE